MLARDLSKLLWELTPDDERVHQLRTLKVQYRPVEMAVLTDPFSASETYREAVLEAVTDFHLIAFYDAVSAATACGLPHARKVLQAVDFAQMIMLVTLYSPMMEAPFRSTERPAERRGVREALRALLMWRFVNDGDGGVLVQQQLRDVLCHHNLCGHPRH